MPKVSGLYIKTDREAPRREIPEGLFRADYGLQGDLNSGGGPRQVCLLRKEDRIRVDQDRRNGLCYPRFRETIQTEDLPLDALNPGDRLRVGPALMEVTLKGKKCFPDCEIIQAGERCPMAETVRFLAVAEDGMVRKGDEIKPL